MTARNIVPRVNGEGGIGTSAKNWLAGWMKNTYSDNVGVGTTAFGTSASKVISIASSAAVAPITSPVDTVQLWAADYNGAGTTRAYTRTEENQSAPLATLNETAVYYGVSWDESSDTYVRTGRTVGHKTGVTLPVGMLPIQESMRGCLVLDDGTVNYYLCDTDWTKKEDGITASDLTGTDGQVMVEVPKFWYRYKYLGTTHTWEVSPVPLTGFKVHEAFKSDSTELNYLYAGAYEGVLYDVSVSAAVAGMYQTGLSACTFSTTDDSISTSIRTNWATNLVVGQRLIVSGTSNNNGVVTVKSVESGTKITVNENLTDETVAGAVVIVTDINVTATTGDKLCSISGFGAVTGTVSAGTRAHFRQLAANRGSGWTQEFVDARSALQLLYLTEYASFYSQSVIGAGISNVADWSTYNDHNPISKTGMGNGIGVASGNTGGSTSAATESTKYMKYRGIENFYGHLWKWLDGFNINNNIPYICNNPANFADDTISNYTRPKDVLGADITMINANGYQSTLCKNGRAFMPASIGADGSHKITDYYYQSTGWRVALSGGHAHDGANDGCFYLHCGYASSALYRYIAARLYFRK